MKWFLLLSLWGTGWAKTPGYMVSQDKNLLNIKTPWGSNLFMAPVGFEDLESYSFEIPLADFRTQARKEATDGPSDNASSKRTDPSVMGDVSSLIVEANRLYNQGDFRHALGYVDEVNQREPQNVRGWIMKGSLMHVMGHRDLAKQAWQKALELDPANQQIQRILKESP